MVMRSRKDLSKIVGIIKHTFCVWFNMEPNKIYRWHILFICYAGVMIQRTRGVYEIFLENLDFDLIPV